MILIGGDVQCIKHMKDLEEETKDNIVEDDIYLTSFLHGIIILYFIFRNITNGNSLFMDSWKCLRFRLL